MSQPKHRRRKARRKARLAPRERPCYVHVSWSGEARNPIGKRASLNTAICVGFGYAVVQRDGVTVIDGEREKRRRLLTSQGVVTLRTVDKYIRRMRQGHCKWTATVRAPLWGATWERKAPGKWVVVAHDEGFA